MKAPFQGGLLLVPELFPFVSDVHDSAEEQTDKHQNDGSQECREKPSNMESGDKGTGQQQDDRIDDQEEDSKGQDADWKRHQFQ